MRVLLGAALALLLLAPQAVATPREERDRYTTGGVFVVDLGCALDLTPGGACFVVRPEDASVAVVIEDATGLPIRATLSFVRADGVPTERVRFCGSTGALPIPPGTAEVLVDFADAPVPACSPAVATAGAVTATFE